MRHSLPLTCVDCLFVFHTASPFEHKVKNAQKELIDPAVKGTANVLMSVAKWNKVARPSDISVKRVVITSSVASIIGPGSQPSNGKVYTEADWNSTSTQDKDVRDYCFHIDFFKKNSANSC